MLLRYLASRFKKENIRTDLEPADFDPDFYFKFYGDLFHLKSQKALKRHYILHGRKEGRFKNWDEARNNFEQRFGLLPADFSAKEYSVRNQDLAPIFNHDWQFVCHYLEHGRREGRAYRRSDYLNRSWVNLFRFADFVACSHGWLAEPIRTKQQAVQIFESQGIERLAPLNLEYIFDPKFYRAAYEFDGNTSDVQLYRHWLEIGLLNGLFPNEERALQSLVADGQYPPCFDWQKYVLHTSFRRKSGARIDALEHLFEFGFDAGLAKQITGNGAGELFAAIGDYHLVRGHHLVSISAYDHAVAAGNSDVGVLHRRGDARAAVGNRVAAQADFLRASSNPGASIWSHIHAARIVAGHGAFEKALDILLKARPKWIKNAEFRTTVNDVIESFFSSKSKAAMALYDTGERDLADELMLDTLEKIRMRIAQLEDLPATLPRAPDGHVAILANQDLVQCSHYRIEQKVRQLKRAGITVTVCNQNEPADFIGSLLGARAAIFYRTPAFPGIVRAIMTANALGIPTYYEIDDLIFDTAYPDSFESYEGQISRTDYSGLLYGVPLFRYAMALCERGITTTTPLAKEIERVVKCGECLVLRNGLDERNENAIFMGSAAPPERDPVTIFYGSGTKAHNSDFNELIGSALLFVLNHLDNVNLVIVGHLELRREFDQFASRIRRFKFVADLDQYWSLLAACDINLAVLSAGIVADCKSEIKWLEAAVLQVPSIVSGTATYREVLEDGVDALIANNEAEWLEALRRLIIDRKLRRRIGASARVKALDRYSLDNGANSLSRALGHGNEPLPLPGGSSGESKSREGIPAKIKLLICNVFFPPQTYGGATRVVKDNVDYLTEHCGDFDVSVFTTDEGISRPGRLRFDRYGAIPVFRLSTPGEENMDWRPFNVDHEEIFSRVLDAMQPDVVHFHCIQRLTASIVEVASRRKIPYIITIHDGWWISDHQFFVDEDGILRLPSTDAFAAVPPAGVSLTDSVARRERLAGLLRRAAHVISVSGAFADIYRAAGCRNVAAIANGVSAMAATARDSDADARLSLGHVGGRTTHKGATLIEAILRTINFDHLKLTMVDMRMEPNARRETLWGNTPVLLRGPCAQHEIAELYASLDVLLAPSIWPESFGLVAREAKAHGLWVIASDRGSMGEGVLEGENGFVIDVADGRALAEVLTTLDANVTRFKKAPPLDTAPTRSAADQGREIVALYRKILLCPPRSESKIQEKAVAQ